MGFSTRFVFGGVVAGAALAYYVRQRHQATGDGYLAIIRQLPGEAERWVDDTRRRTALALEEGKSAARVREAEIGLRLTTGRSMDPGS